MNKKAKDSVARLEPELASLIRRSDMINRQRAYPLERAHYLLLGCIERGEKSTGEIAQALGLDHSTVVRQISAVENRQLVVRLPNPADRRSVLVKITAEGATHVAQMRALRRVRLENLLTGWSEADLQQFATLLSRFNADLMRTHTTLSED